MRNPATELTILSIPDCPNTALLQQRLADELTDRPDLRIQHHVITDEAEAQQYGMRGSPTLLVDGHDPFPAPHTQPSLSCRIYWGDDATAQGAPTPAQLRAALATTTS